MSSTSSDINKRLIIWIILAITPLVSFCLDEYAPSLPHMVKALHSTTSHMQLSITLYILALGISQWIFGVLSDRFGRRPIFNYGIIIALVGTLVCIFANNSHILLLGRFIQGFGMGSAATTFAALTGDIFKGKELNKVASYTTFIYGMVPIVAPLLGGYIQVYAGWRANFTLMFIVVLVVSIFVSIKLPETHSPTETHRLVFRQMFKNYVKILSSTKYIGSVCCLIFSWTLIIGFSIIAPFLLQVDLGLTAVQYGHAALLIGLAYLSGNALSSFLMHTFSVKSIMLYGVLIILFSSILLLLASLILAVTWWLVILPAFIAILGVGLLFPCAYGSALGEFTELAGLAGSLIGSLMCFGAVILTFVISALSISSYIGFAVIYFVLAILCAISFLISIKVTEGE